MTFLYSINTPCNNVSAYPSGSVSSVLNKMIRPLILALFLLRIEGSNPEISSFRPSSILRSVNGGNNKIGGERPDYSVELNATDFDSVLKETPATYAIVNFFAHWCPACRNYKPHYEKVARLFNGADAVHPGIIFMARVDCALKINPKLCDDFSIGHYPMLLWGPPSKFASGSWDPRQEKSDIHSIDDGRTADRLLNWINKKMGSSYGLEDDKYENEHLHTNTSDRGQVYPDDGIATTMESNFLPVSSFAKDSTSLNGDLFSIGPHKKPKFVANEGEE